MTNFIEEFYYGNIDPQARSFEQNQKVQRDIEILTDKDWRDLCQYWDSLKC